MKAMMVLMLLFVAHVAQAYPTHTLQCNIGNPAPEKSVYLEVDESNLGSGLANVTLSNWASSWKPFEEAIVEASLKWTWNPRRSQKIISAIAIDMGRSGFISAKMIVAPDKYNRAQAKLTSSVRGLYYPTPVHAVCSYFLVVGPRPGLSGSN